MTHIVINDNLLLGGGPSGIAGIIATDASRHDHTVAYITHDNRVRAESNVFPLTQDQLLECDTHVKRANKSIHRAWPTNINLVDNQIRRDVLLVQWCQKVYAVGLFTDDASLLKVAGNLAWPCQAYVDRFLYDQEPMSTCELYMFDLKAEAWFMWSSRWVKIIKPPVPEGIYAVVGNERLTQSTKQELDNLWIA